MATSTLPLAIRKSVLAITTSDDPRSAFMAAVATYERAGKRAGKAAGGSWAEPAPGVDFYELIGTARANRLLELAAGRALEIGDIVTSRRAWLATQPK